MSENWKFEPVKQYKGQYQKTLLFNPDQHSMKCGQWSSDGYTVHDSLRPLNFSTCLEPFTAVSCFCVIQAHHLFYLIGGSCLESPMWSELSNSYEQQAVSMGPKTVLHYVKHLVRVKKGKQIAQGNCVRNLNHLLLQLNNLYLQVKSALNTKSLNVVNLDVIPLASGNEAKDPLPTSGNQDFKGVPPSQCLCLGS